MRTKKPGTPSRGSRAKQRRHPSVPDGAKQPEQHMPPASLCLIVPYAGANRIRYNGYPLSRPKQHPD